MYLWIILVVVALLFYTTVYKKTLYWKERNVIHFKAIPFLGSLAENFIKRKPLHNLLIDMYNKFPKAKYVGFHQFNSPILLIRDLELIKYITVKDFDSFMNHTVLLTEDLDPLFGKNLVNLSDQKWRNMRATLSPAFTGSKMRAMYTLINDCAKQFVEYFLKEAKNENGMVRVEMKDIFTRYTNDVIATAAFGIQCDSLANKENEFYTAGKTATNLGGFSVLFKFMGFFISAKLMTILGIRLIDTNATTFFRNLILTALRIREKEGIIRPDMIHLLMEAKKGQLKQESPETDSGFSSVDEPNIEKSQEKQALTDEDIVAQAFLFFFAGYDTGSTLMSFMAYELALNPEVQNKLHDEIDNVINTTGINYESILKLKYLDMVVSESLRMWPPAAFVERLSSKPYLIENTNDNEPPLLLEKNTTVWIPVYAIHHDSKYFSNPKKFDPERFSDENKYQIQPFTYLPFGVGPRNCIGSRFALLEVKTLFVYILSKFEFQVIKETQIPLKLDTSKIFNLAAEKGIWLGLKVRKTK